MRQDQDGRRAVSLPTRGTTVRPLPRISRETPRPSVTVRNTSSQPTPSVTSTPPPAPAAAPVDTPAAIAPPIVFEPPVLPKDTVVFRAAGKPQRQVTHDINFSIIPDAPKQLFSPPVTQTSSAVDTTPAKPSKEENYDAQLAAIENLPEFDISEVSPVEKAHRLPTLFHKKTSKKQFRRTHSAAKKPSKHARVTKPTRLMTVSTIGLVVTGIMTVIQLMQTPNITTGVSSQASAQEVLSVHSAVLSRTDTTPDTSAPTEAEVAAHTVAGSLPRVLTVDSLGIHSRVTRTAENEQGQLFAPSNIHDAAWYHDSARTGAAGVSMLVGSSANDGVFARLGELKLNDTLRVERGDSTLYNYSVYKIERGITKESNDQLLETPDSTAPWLLLVSCPTSNSAVCSDTGRTVVYARQI